MSSESKSLFNAPIALAVASAAITGFAFYSAYAYEIGYANVFGIPHEMIQIRFEDIAWSFLRAINLFLCTSLLLGATALLLRLGRNYAAIGMLVATSFLFLYGIGVIEPAWPMKVAVVIGFIVGVFGFVWWLICNSSQFSNWMASRASSALKTWNVVSTPQEETAGAGVCREVPRTGAVWRRAIAWTSLVFVVLSFRSSPMGADEARGRLRGGDFWMISSECASSTGCPDMALIRRYGNMGVFATVTIGTKANTKTIQLGPTYRTVELTKALSYRRKRLQGVTVCGGSTKNTVAVIPGA